MCMSYENISNAALGAKIKRDHRRHLERIERMTPIWEEEGKENPIIYLVKL